MKSSSGLRVWTLNLSPMELTRGNDFEYTMGMLEEWATFMESSRRKFLFVALACVSFPFHALAASSIGQVIAVAGQVTAAGEDNKPRPLALKSAIYLNDKIVTAKDAKVQVMFDDDSVVSEGESSELLIDQYVYDPREGKKGDCSLKLAKGVFRVITGKITDLNPERFKVRTKMATIGIRGCELGFRLRKDKEDILVLHLPKGKTIVIKKTMEELHGDIREQLEQVLHIVEPGMAVTIEPEVSLKERPIRSFEVRQIVEESTPTPVSAEHDSDLDRSEEGSGGLIEVGSVKDSVEQSAAVASQSISSQAAQGQVALGRSAPDSPELVWMSSPPPLPSGPKDPPEEQLPPPDDIGPALIVGIGNPPDGPFPSHWEWGIWEDGSVQYWGNRYLGDTFLSAADYQSIVDGTQIYNLTDDGMGQCAAVVHYGGATRLLGQDIPGTVTMNVQVGTAVTPFWGATFSMGNFDGDALSFSVVGGTIGPGGSLSGTSSGYSLSLAGVSSLPSLTSESISGNLIRPAVLPAPPASPINAAAGEFHFAHGTVATVDGAFGVNLQ